MASSVPFTQLLCSHILLVILLLPLLVLVLLVLLLLLGPLQA